jgi:hypothetical protein
LREGKQAAQIRPLADDAVDGATVLCSLALIHAWLGNVDAALAQLTALATTPGGPPYGQLKFDPAWDAVRNDPRFAAMLRQVAPRPKE